jgi:hypothetical protein
MSNTQQALGHLNQAVAFLQSTPTPGKQKSKPRKWGYINGGFEWKGKFLPTGTKLRAFGANGVVYDAEVGQGHRSGEDILYKGATPTTPVEVTEIFYKGFHSKLWCIRRNSYKLWSAMKPGETDYTSII